MSQAAGEPEKISKADEETILAEIRERYSYASTEWRKIRDEAATDMRYVAGDPWTPAEREAREKAGRPALKFDELSQYLNQTINDVRRNKRGVKVSPQGGGATDQTAELRQSLIRQIEYRSNAQTVAYTTMFENTVQRSYGFLRIRATYENPRSINQELRIDAIPNPDLVTPDPDNLEPTGADWKYLFLRESRSVKDFQREWPTAQIKSFDGEVAKVAGAGDWTSGERVFIAEYWTIENKREHLLILDRPVLTKTGEPRQDPYVSELGIKPADVRAWLASVGVQVQADRWVDVPYVCQYMTNGFELLAKKGASKKTAWPGRSIPFVMCPGKVLYLTESGITQKVIESLIRKARDPQMYHAYINSNQAELIKMTPKTPYVGYEGQFRGHEDDWVRVSDEPLAYLEARPTTEGTGQQVLPLPQRQAYDPPIQSLEIAKESARRSIQAAMGISPMPTSAQRRNEKSGVALKEMRDAEQTGSYHFVDHYELALIRTGTILDELIPHYYDAARTVTLRKPDDTPEVRRINDPEAPQPADLTVGEHDVTISVGPAFASQREAAETFADSLAQSPVFPQIADLVVKLKELGPIGDEIAERLTPPEFRQKKDGQPPSQAEVAQMQLQLQEMQTALQQAQQIIETEQAKQQATIETARIKAEADVQIAQIKAQMDFEAKVLEIRQRQIAAEQQAAAQVVQSGNEAEQAERARQHEAAMAAAGADSADRSQGREHDHAASMAERQAQHRAAEQQAAADSGGE